MMSKPISFSLLFLLITFSSFSQERATINRLKHDKEVCKAFAEKSIQEISDGVLLVRLNFHQKQIDYMTSIDRGTAAAGVRQAALSENQNITKAFSTGFDFCQVYFFRMCDSKYVLNQEFDSLTFYDEGLNEVTDFSIEADKYLIGQFAQIQQDTTHYYEIDRIDTGVDNSKSKVYYGGTKNGREAFVLLDRKFQQIEEPFPYFAPLQLLAPEKTRYRKAVIKMNVELRNYARQFETKEEKEE